MEDAGETAEHHPHTEAGGVAQVLAIAFADRGGVIAEQGCQGHDAVSGCYAQNDTTAATGCVPKFCTVCYTMCDSIPTNEAVVQLDSIDWAILDVLQNDAATPIHAIGERVGLSTNPCWRRIRRMEEAGVIARRVALLDPAALGLNTTVFVAIRTARHDREWLDAFAAGIATIPEITECHRMAGEVDYLLKLTVRDIAHYDRIYQRLIAAVPGLSDVSSSFSMEALKRTTVLPRPR